MMFLWAFVLLAVATSSVNSQCSQSRSYNQVIQKSLEEHSNTITKYKGGKQSLGLLGILIPFNSLTNMAFLSVKIKTIEIRNTTTNGLLLAVELIIPASCDELLNIEMTVNITCGLSVTLRNGYPYLELKEETLKIFVGLKGDKILGLIATLLTAVLNLLTTILLGLIKILLGLVCSDLNLYNTQLLDIYYINDVACHHSLTSVIQVGSYAYGGVTTYAGNQSVAWGEGNNYVFQEGENQLWHVKGDLITTLVQAASTAVTITISLSPESWSTESWGAKYSNLHILIKMKAVKSCTFTGKGANIIVVLSLYLYDGTAIVASFDAELTLIAQTRYQHGHFGLNCGADLALGLDLVLTNPYVDSSCGCGSVIPSWFQLHAKLYLNLLLDNLNCKWRKLMPLPTIYGKPGSNGKCVSQEGLCRCSSD